MKIIEEYKRLTEEIAVIESKLQSAKRELEKQTEQYKPREIQAIDYSEEKVQKSVNQQDMIETYDIVTALNESIVKMEEEMRAIIEQRKKIEIVIENVGGKCKQVLMLSVQGKKPNQISSILECDIRHVFRLLKEGRRQIEKKIF